MSGLADQPDEGKGEEVMSRIRNPWPWVFAVLLSSAGPQEVSAQEWDPISIAASIGSWAVSTVYQENDGPGQSEAGISSGGRNPNAFEFQFGDADVDQPTGADDAFYLSLGYRRYLTERLAQQRVRFFVGAGAGVYFVDPDDELGLNVKLGGSFAVVPKRPDRLHWPFELAVTHHRLDSGVDFTDFTIGVRLHLPGN